LSQYRRKHAIIEARQHEGAKIVVASNLKGNQGAADGDYLVTDPTAPEPRGSVYVVPKADFERDHELVEEGERAEARRDYPDYISHKEVSAAKIESIDWPENGTMVLHLDGFEEPFTSEPSEGKPKPEVGWYLIVYSDGYTSFSPAKAFEEGYRAK
jgi:hypothetical protein